ncbi:MAG: hypothetical protein ACK4UP_00955 [Spirosomataceae bacterium]
MRILVVPLPKSIAGMALWPFILVRYKNPSPQLIRHEQIHLRQQVELGIFLFYFWYLMEFLVRFLWTRSVPKAYRSICFEQEAFANQTDELYLSVRKRWTFLTYL